MKSKLSHGVKKVAWGYLFIHLDFTLFVINILPNWAGFILFFSALSIIGEEDESAVLLRPLCAALGIWEGILWAASIIGLEINSTILQLIVNIIGIYFHFQLLTNLAVTAERYRCPQAASILRLRTLRTVLATLLALPFPYQDYEVLLFIGMLVSLAVAIWLIAVLFSLRRSLAEIGI